MQWNKNQEEYLASDKEDSAQSGEEEGNLLKRFIRDWSVWSGECLFLSGCADIVISTLLKFKELYLLCMYI